MKPERRKTCSRVREGGKGGLDTFIHSFVPKKSQVSTMEKCLDFSEQTCALPTVREPSVQGQ